MRLPNQIVFITDSDSDSGKAMISRLTESGAHFILNSYSGGSAIGAELKLVQDAGLQAIVVSIDLCKSTEVSDMLLFAEQQLGTVDILVHNNKEIFPSTIEDGEEELFQQSIALNAKSAFICTQAVGKQMMIKQAGKIIYVSSIHAEKPTGSAFTYSIAKGAVKMLSKEAALVLGRYGISVNTIEVGAVAGDDELFHSNLSTLYNDYEFKVPNAVLCSYEDLAELVYFLSSEEARLINGTDIRLDGGFLLHYMNFKMKKP
ncbi:SDR family NAD(P)-dependent oxidoreductase [Bacillus sp. FJAT-28004]|uniref:SDR family NAD(P)-dependent oxidoreductase n=1 Tax=Bacillus sp. FJAT-28004 TaxID=1679165 RepID=UPI0006B44CD5|nr:SDR family oxidoreductase [Bacillus sp. FJAT-28004]